VKEILTKSSGQLLSKEPIVRIEEPKSKVPKLNLEYSPDFNFNTYMSEVIDGLADKADF
jgi:hypothetical protein